MIDETFLTTEEVLEYLQVNLRTVYRLIKAGKIPGGPRRPPVALPQARHRRLARQPAAARRRRAPRRRRRRRRGPRPARRVRASSSSTTRRASAICSPRRWRSPSTTWTSRPTAARRSSACGCIPYDLLIADLKMPGMDGLTVIREAKRYKADLPVIIITGFSTESSAIEAVNLGVAGYLTKPFRVPQVLRPPQRHWANNALGENDPALRPDQVLRRPRPVRPRHVADHGSRARRPVRPERRRQDDAAPDDGRASTSPTPARSSSRRR